MILITPFPAEFILGLFTSFEDNLDAEPGPDRILRLLKIRLPKGPQSSREDIQYFVKKEVWDRSFHMARGGFSRDQATGKSKAAHSRRRERQ